MFFRSSMFGSKRRNSEDSQTLTQEEQTRDRQKWRINKDEKDVTESRKNNRKTVPKSQFTKVGQKRGYLDTH